MLIAAVHSAPQHEQPARYPAGVNPALCPGKSTQTIIHISSFIGTEQLFWSAQSTIFDRERKKMCLNIEILCKQRICRCKWIFLLQQINTNIWRNWKQSLIIIITEKLIQVKIKMICIDLLFFSIKDSRSATTHCCTEHHQSKDLHTVPIMLPLPGITELTHTLTKQHQLLTTNGVVQLPMKHKHWMNSATMTSTDQVATSTYRKEIEKSSTIDCCCPISDFRSFN